MLKLGHANHAARAFTGNYLVLKRKKNPEAILVVSVNRAVIAVISGHVGSLYIYTIYEVSFAIKHYNDDIIEHKVKEHCKEQIVFQVKCRNQRCWNWNIL